MLDFDHFRCLSFDCYGTLIDWETGLVDSLSPVLAGYGIQLDRNELLGAFAAAEEKLEALAFRPYRQILMEVLDEIGRRFEFDPTDDEREGFGGSVATWPAFQDSTEALTRLQSRYRLVILSNIDDDLFAHSERRLGINFDDVFTAQRIGAYKPSRQNFDFLIANSGVPQAQMLHVAQSMFHDIAPAQQMGLMTAWVNRRHGQDGTGATPEAKAIPDLTVTSLRELADLACS